MKILVIKLICNVGRTIGNDPAIGDRLKVVFVENYRVSLGMDKQTQGKLICIFTLFF